MALKALNSVAGFSVGEVANVVIYANTDISTANLVVSAKSNLNSISNVIITGGSPGYLVSTDGAGNLSFIAPPSTTGITNGTSNVSIPQLNGNITLNVNGTANVGLFTQTSLDMQGNVNPATANTYQLGNATNRWNNVYANTANIFGNISAGGLLTNNLYYANGSPWDLQEAAGANYEIQFNIDDNFAASANFTYNDSTQLFTVLGNSQFNNSNLGNLAIANFVNVASNTITSNLTVNLELAGNTANFTGNIKSLNANLGDIANANFVNVTSNTLTSNLTVNLELAGNTANFTGNVVAGNFVGALANGNSNVKVYSNSNVEVTVSGTPNVATFATTGLYVVGEINTTAGNMLSNGNVTANGFLNSANANVTGEGKFGSVLTGNITAPSGAITISAAGVNQNITLNPSGTGNVDVGLHNIVQVGSPVNPNDAATKEYVDSLAQGLTIHPPVRVEANIALTGAYVQGGTTQVTTDITGGKTISFSAIHGLNINDGIVWDNSFNGIVGGEAYWVYSVPALNQITIKDGYNGAEVTTLTNQSGLTQSSRANPGVGATLTNTGLNAPLVIDSVTVANGDRVLVYSQANSYENGVYDVTDSGTISTAWVLTRSSDMNKYIPQSTSGLGYGDYLFVQQGGSGAGESYVLTSPQGEVIIGTDGITFTQFGAAGVYTAGNGISLTGTTISANTDGVTTDIVGGNIVVKSGANLTTPNIGDAKFSSLTWNNLSNGNITANNLSVGNLANVTGNLTIAGNIQANYAISSNANVSGANLTTSGQVSATGNITGGNLVTSNTVSAGNVSVSSTTTTNDLTVNNAITGNTANFSGNLVANNIKSNLEFVGNTANFSGNVILPNLTVNLELSGNTANFSGAILGNSIGLEANLVIANVANGGVVGAGVFTDNLYYSNGAPWDLQEAAGSNTQIQYNDGTNDFGASANLTFDDSTQIFSVNGTANIATTVLVGNTAVKWGTLTTSTTTANQTIASISTTGVTGLEFLVKGVDATGTKYSVATVQAVTDGTSVDYATYGTVNLGGFTGSLAVNIDGGFVRLQVTPASGNSTVWTTQVRVI